MPDISEHDPSPFHAGERQVQARLGVSDIEDWARKVVRPYLPEEHRAFHTALPYLIVAARDGDERPWVTLLTGDEGFVTSPDPNSLVMAAKPVAGDALAAAFVPGADIGILGIELATRRRNRLNGRIIDDGGVGAIVCGVEQTFGNCPQYIRERAWRRIDGNTPGRPIKGTRLTDSQIAWITDADTFFIASGYRDTDEEGENPAFGMDASHRGGARGFVQVDGDGCLVFPDYAGNNHYNTIGNLVLDPRVGLLFVDFETRSLLQLSGIASIDWGSEAVDNAPGARRLVTVRIEQIVELPAALSLRWDRDADAIRSLRLIEKIPESADVTSFVFESRDGGPLPEFEAGQHLPIELEVPEFSEPIRRTYSLSAGPGTGDGPERYRISVKREAQGIASRHLHDHVDVGAFINMRHPAGDFMLSCARCPVVLVSAGVGLTPLVAMLHVLAGEGGSRPVWFVHGARDGAHHPLADEVRQLCRARSGIALHVAYSKPRPEDGLGTDHDSAGRVDAALLAGLVENADAHYFLCGPTRFMADLQTGLEQRGIPAAQIHSETFGPVG